MAQIIRLTAICLILTAGSAATAQNTLPAEIAGKADHLAAIALAKFATPGASIAVVYRGKLAYVKAYGMSRMEPPTAAGTETRFLIGSISKQFTAAAILLLQEQGKLTLDDRIAKYLPDLTRAGDITVRQVLSHTAGYQDNWPEDYLTPAMKKPTTPQHILDIWAKKPLDFEPGTQWQYSNTGFLITGLIVEKVSGKSLFAFLKERIFQPLGMRSVFDINAADLPPDDSIGYTSYALGPQRVAPKGALGWYLGYGQLAMTAHDLALWDIAMIDRRILGPTSWAQMEQEIVLKDGKGCGYGLGVALGKSAGRRYVDHGGEMSGYVAHNIVYPAEGLAVVVLCNSDTTEAPRRISGAISALVAERRATQPAATQQESQSRVLRVRQILAGLAAGKIDRSLLSDDCNDYFNDEVLHDYASTLALLGEPKSIVEGRSQLRGGLVFRAYTVTFADEKLNVWTRVRPDGKFQQYMVFRLPE